LQAESAERVRGSGDNRISKNSSTTLQARNLERFCRQKVWGKTKEMQKAKTSSGAYEKSFCK